MQTTTNKGLQPNPIMIVKSLKTGKIINYNDVEAAAKQDPEAMAWMLIEQMTPVKKGNILDYRRRTAIISGRRRSLDNLLKTYPNGQLPGKIVYKDFNTVDDSPEYTKLQKEYFNWELGRNPEDPMEIQIADCIEANIERFKHKMSYKDSENNEKTLYFEDEKGNQFIRFKFWDPTDVEQDRILSLGNTSEVRDFFQSRKAELLNNKSDEKPAENAIVVEEKKSAKKSVIQ